METSAKLNRTRWAVQVALITGLALLFLAALLWGLQGVTPARADPGTLYVDGASGQDVLTCGTTIAPCQTISYALNSRASDGDTIRVAQGTYTENLTINISVTLKGGYSGPPNWDRDVALYETVILNGQVTMPGDWDGRTVGKPAVIRDGAELKMWYDGHNLDDETALGLATSTDGLTWTKSVSNPVLVGTPGDWDGGSGEHGSYVIKEDGIYKMWYEGSPDDGVVRQTGYATSTDGIEWNKYPGNPVIQAGPEGYDQDTAGHGSVLHEGGTYKRWYHALAGVSATIAYATAPDEVTWTKQGTVLLPQPGGWDGFFLWGPSVLKLDGTYWMWYTAVGPMGPPAIGVVTSTDGISWTRFLTGPVVSGKDPVGDPMVISDSGKLKMWFTNYDRGAVDYAESENGVDWTLYPENPVLEPGNLASWGGRVVHLDRGSDGVVLDGFTITGGDTFAGGGLLIANGGSALVSNCTITGNQSHGWGGGVWVTDADATIRDSTISHNSSGGSAGIEVNHDFGPAYLDLVSCRVEHNVGGQIGGMQVWGDQAAATVTDSVFCGNEGENGGGIALSNSSSIVISDTVVFSNTAYNAGAGIAVREGSSASIRGTQIYANTAQGGEGGGISAEGSDISLTDSWVVGNVAQNNEGGGIAVGQGSFHGENCIIAGNTSGTNGGGLWLVEDGPFQLVNCDIVGNSTENEGGALATTRGTQIEITNTLIISNGGHTGIADRDESGSTITLGYCDTFGNSPDGTDGVTIIRNDCLGTPPEDGLDPLMSGGALPGGVGPAFATQWMSYDYRLEAASPAIGAGTPAGAPPADIEGTPRDATPDLGAYEWTGSCVYLPLAVRNYSAPTEVFKLGVLGPFSGPVSDTGDEFGGAVNMAFDAIDWRIGEYKIEPIWIDSESDPAKAAQNYEEAILQDGIEAGLLNWHSSVGVACMEVVADHQVPHFAGMGASIEVNETFNGDRERYGYWTTKWWPAPSKLNVSYVEMLEHAISSGAWSPAAKTVVISGEDTDWGHAFGDAIKYNLQAAGWTVLAEAYFSPGQTDFSSELAVLKTLNPTVVAGSSYSAVSVFALLNQAHAAELESVIILDGLGYMGDWYGETGDSSNYVLNQMPPGWITTEAQTFADAYEERYGESPSPSAAGLAYDAANFFINVAEAVYKETGELSSEALYQFVQDEVWTGQWSYTDGIMMEEYKYTEETIPDPVVGQGAYMFPVLQYFDGEGMIVFPPEWADQPFTPPGG